MGRVNAYIPKELEDVWKQHPNKSKLIQWALRKYIEKKEDGTTSSPGSSPPLQD